MNSPPLVAEANELPFRILTPAEAPKVSNRVRYFPTVKAAAGAFSASQSADETVWAEIADAYRVSSDMFVVQVVGESMNRRIPNGSWCLFRQNPAGSREGKIVLVQHHSISDPDSGGAYTVKRYRSEKGATEDSWAHRKITLWPDSTDRTFTPIAVTLAGDDEFRVVGELVAIF
jgi:phage repressor protein C with HTH and peptisase S24 domain